MELRQLRHFLAVVEHGSFSRAAEAVHLTQPALSRSIQALEAQVGAAVLDRNRGDITPTDVGKLLLDHARQLEAATRDLERDIALTRGLELGELVIGVGPYGGSALVGPVIGQLMAQHPRLHIKTVLAPWQELPERVRARQVDLIVVELSQVELMEDFAVAGLSQYRLEAVCRPQHPLVQNDHPQLLDIFEYPVAGPTPTPRQLEAVMAQMPEPQRQSLLLRGPLAVECDHSGMLKDILRHCNAIALIPRFMVTEELAQGQLCCLSQVDAGLGVRFGGAWLQSRTLSPVAKRFMELLAEHDRALQAASRP